MLKGALSGTGLVHEPCKHEFDESKLPEWHKTLGKIYTCMKCGEKLCAGTKPVPHGSKVRCSKKDRRRLRKLQVAIKETPTENE